MYANVRIGVQFIACSIIQACLETGRGGHEI